MVKLIGMLGHEQVEIDVANGFSDVRITNAAGEQIASYRVEHPPRENEYDKDEPNIRREKE